MRKVVIILLAIIPLALVSCHKDPVDITEYDIVKRDIKIINATRYNIIVEVKGERYLIYEGERKAIPDTAWAWDRSTGALVYSADSIVVELDTATMRPSDEYFRIVHRRTVVDSVVSYEPALHNMFDLQSYSLSFVEVSVDEERGIRHWGTIEYYGLTAYDINPAY